MALSNEELINGFKNNDRRTIITAYKMVANKIGKYVLYNKGTEEDAESLVWESIEIFRQKCQKKEALEIKATIKDYIYGIARYSWLNKLKKTKEISTLFSPLKDKNEVQIDYPEPSNPPFNDEFKELLELVELEISRLSEKCQKIFELRFDLDLSHKEIAQKLGLTSIVNARQRFFSCKTKLRAQIVHNPVFKEFEDNDLVLNFILGKK